MPTNIQVIEYLDGLDQAKQEAINKLRQTIKSNSNNIEETFESNMIVYVIPKSVYPPGYHATNGTPLPYMAIAAQKNYLSVYMFGLYFDPTLLAWFKENYQNQYARKLDAGKSCLRFKKVEHIPYDLIAKLCLDLNVEKFITLYETNLKRN